MPEPGTRPTLGSVTAIFLRIANTTFGGGLPTIAALEREFVHRRHWLSEEDYGLAFAVARVTPGTNVIAFCAATGARMIGFLGAVSGAFSETLPSAVLAVLLTQGYESWRTNPTVMAAVAATVAAVVGMMWSSIYGMVQPHWGGIERTARALVIVGGSFLALWKFGVNPLTIIVAAALLGLVWKEPERA